MIACRVALLLALGWALPAEAQLEHPPRIFLVSGNTRLQSADQAVGSQQLTGQSFAVVADEIPAGPLSLELTFIETEASGPDQRQIALFANGTLLTPQLDVWREAGGAGRPLVRVFPLHHDGGRLTVSLSGLGRDALLAAVRLLAPDGTVITAAPAATMPRLRETVRDARTHSYRPTSPDEQPFFNVDHSPPGAYATFIYGMEDSGGLQNSPGRRATTGDLVPHDGLIIAAQRGTETRLMPFTAQASALPQGGSYVRADEVRHRLGACTDRWSMPLGVSWTHYSPYWLPADFERTTVAEKKRGVLPATWMVFDLDNSEGTEELRVLLSPKQRASVQQTWGELAGYVIDRTNALACRASEASCLSAAEARRQFGVDEAHAAFLLRVPAGQKRTVTFYVAHYLGEELSRLQNEPLVFAYTSFYADLGEVVHAAAVLQDEAMVFSRQFDRRIEESGASPPRQFLAAQALHSYAFNTILRETRNTRRPLWTVIEGEYGYANTFDLTIDHVFLELALHPWTVRNTLDLFFTDFAYTDEVRLPGQTARQPGGLGFAHDMGMGFKLNPGATATYGGSMTQEELQNWILCAGLYWKATADNIWLAAQRDALVRCLQSMQVRDDPDPARRDGIPSLLSCIGTRDHDITTYDAMDASLQQVNDSLYLSVKSFAAYLSLEAMFTAIGDPAQAQTARHAAGLTAGGILRHWDESSRCFPALFNTTTPSRIIPAVEGLVYPYAMGLREAVSPDGPYGELIRKLRVHLDTVLAPGVCLDPRTGGWWLSSTSHTTWQSKVYLGQFISEQILGLRDARTEGTPDIAHMSYQLNGAPAVGWSDQIRHRDGTAYGGRHYPRGVTSALWWLPLPATLNPPPLP